MGDEVAQRRWPAGGGGCRAPSTGSNPVSFNPAANPIVVQTGRRDQEGRLVVSYGRGQQLSRAATASPCRRRSGFRPTGSGSSQRLGRPAAEAAAQHRPRVAAWDFRSAMGLLTRTSGGHGHSAFDVLATERRHPPCTATATWSGRRHLLAEEPRQPSRLPFSLGKAAVAGRGESGGLVELSIASAATK